VAFACAARTDKDTLCWCRQRMWCQGGVPVPASDEDAEVGAELGERGGRGAPDAAGAAEHEHAGGPRGRPLRLGSVPGGGCGGGSAHGGRRRACSDRAHGGHSVGLSPRLGCCAEAERMGRSVARTIGMSGVWSLPTPAASATVPELGCGLILAHLEGSSQVWMTAHELPAPGNGDVNAPWPRRLVESGFLSSR
jgi:hypothetical protein